MKKILILLSFLVLIISCGEDTSKSIEKIIESKDIKALRSKRNEVVKEQQTIANQLREIDNAIAALDTVKKLPLVTTIIAKDTLFNHYLELQGNVETKQNIVLYPEMGGVLTRVYVKEGQKVTKGQVLARIDDGGMSQQLSQIEVQAQLAKTTFERQKRLWEQKIGSEIQYLQAKTTYEAQQNAVKQIKSQLAKTTINAPFSGVIDNVISEQGSVVSPGQNQVIRIVNLSNMYIQTEVPERYIPNVTVGKNVPSKGGVVKPNLTAKVKINDYTNKSAILIPQSILSENAEGQQYTYITSEKDNQNIAKAKRVVVKTGKTQGDLIEILEGINPGDAVISEGARSVKDGQKVKILN